MYLKIKNDKVLTSKELVDRLTVLSSPLLYVRQYRR